MNYNNLIIKKAQPSIDDWAFNFHHIPSQEFAASVVCKCIKRIPAFHKVTKFNRKSKYFIIFLPPAFQAASPSGWSWTNIRGSLHPWWHPWKWRIPNRLLVISVQSRLGCTFKIRYPDIDQSANITLCFCKVKVSHKYSIKVLRLLCYWGLPHSCSSLTAWKWNLVPKIW